MRRVIHFVLVSDRFAGRLVRRQLAEARGWLGVQVGTWTELLELCKSSYRLSTNSQGWEKLLESIPSSEDSFWYESSRVAEKEVVESISQTLNVLIEERVFEALSTSPDKWKSIPKRCRRHLEDLESLWQRAGHCLPPDLAIIRDILEAPQESALYKLVVYTVGDLPQLSPWQQSLLTRLESDSTEIPRKSSLESLIEKAMITSSNSSSQDDSTLRFIQENIYEEDVTAQVKYDSSVQFISCRDYREEIEIALSMIQHLSGSSDLAHADFAFLVPDGDKYTSAIHEASVRAGVPVSCLEAKKKVRDIGRECIRLFLLTRQRPAPLMALASLLASPMMPWKEVTGMSLAQQAVSGRLQRSGSLLSSKNEKRMLALIRSSHQNIDQLSSGLKEFVALLRNSDQAEQKNRALQAADKVYQLLKGAELIDWSMLLSGVTPAPEVVSRRLADPKDGVAIFREHGEPWRRVKYLFTLGFSEGNYPGRASVSSVFSALDLETLQGLTGTNVNYPANGLERNRQRFKRQLMSASMQVNFFVPRYDNLSKELGVSSSLYFMASLIGEYDDPEDLILSVDIEAEVQKISGLPNVFGHQPQPPRKLYSQDLELHNNLLELGKYDDGTIRSQSPSSLATLISCPFAWLLNRTGVVPREWAPEELDILIKGTLAHEVFEHLFSPGTEIPQVNDIGWKVAELLRSATEKTFPYLLKKEWHVERQNLEREIVVAAEAWRNIIEGLGAKTIAAEPWLSGELDGLPIRGKADLLIQLPSGQYLVVDYKKSSSTSRRKQMESGYDSQAELYRIMVMENGVPEVLPAAPNNEVGSMYFLMNDRVALVDQLNFSGIVPAGVEKLGVDIATNAMQLIEERVSEVKSGHVRLNRITDEQWYERNAGIKLYALDDSPLFRLFLVEEVDA